MTYTLKGKNRLGIYLYIFFAGLIATVVMRTVACFNGLDLISGYFNDKGLITAADITLVAFMLILFLHKFTHSGADTVPKEDFGTPATYIPLGGLAVSVLFLVIELVIELLNMGKVFSSVTGVVKLITAVLGLLSIATFMMNILIEKKLSQLRGAFSILTILFFAMYSIGIYLGTDMPANSPTKILTEFAFIFTAIFFLYETRISLGHSKWHSYAAFGLMTALLLAYTSVPAIIFYLSGEGAVLAGGIAELAAMLMLTLFVGARTLLLAFAQDDEVCELAESIIDMNYERQRHAEESPSEPLARGLNLNVETAPENEASEAVENSND